jgi:flavodoxin
MKKALIIYHSKTGTTKNLANEIGNFCNQNGIDPQVVSIEEFKKDALKDVDYLFLGCWTHGLMILFQHPDEHWVKFADSLPELKGKKIGLFTTYKIATGSMFNKMKKHINCETGDFKMELKSRDGKLHQSNTDLLKNIFNN